jgi:ABC transporter substrate binding protein
VRRREVIASIAVATSLPTVALAQVAGRMYRIGWVMAAPLSDPAVVAVLDELKSNGFILGKNLTVDSRGASLRPDQMLEAARQIAEDKADLLLTAGPVATRAVQAVTKTIPILAVADDMVSDGLVESLANRRGNTTGMSFLSADLDGKRQELLIELFPRAKKMAMLTDGTNTKVALLQARARESGVDVSVLPIPKPDDIQPALKKAKADGHHDVRRHTLLGESNPRLLDRVENAHQALGIVGARRRAVELHRPLGRLRDIRHTIDRALKPLKDLRALGGLILRIVGEELLKLRVLVRDGEPGFRGRLDVVRRL